jgi:hypothetical protein
MKTPSAPSQDEMVMGVFMTFWGGMQQTIDPTRIEMETEINSCRF